MRLFSYAENVVKRKIDIQTALELVKEINKLNLPPSKLDIGLLTAEFVEEKSVNINDFLNEKLLKLLMQKMIFYLEILFFLVLEELDD